MQQHRIEFDPTQYRVQMNPYPDYRLLRDQAPVYWIEALQAFALTRYEDCKNTFLHPERYSARDFIKQAFGDLDPVPEVPSLIAMDPPAHTPLHKLASQGFRPSLVRALEPKIHAIVDGLLDDVEASGRSFDFVSDFAAYVPVSVTAELLGVDASQRENFKEWTSDLLKAANRASLKDADVVGIRASVAKLRAYLEERIAERRKAPAEDFLSLLVKADGDTLSPIQVLSIATLTHFGGSETPSHLISSSLIALFENPPVLEEVRNKPELAEKLVDETLRYWSTVHLVFQTAAQDLELHGVGIPEDSYVVSNIAPTGTNVSSRIPIVLTSTGTRAATFPSPSVPGAALGKRMATIALERVLARMPELRRLKPTTEWLPSLWVRGAKTLPVVY